MRQPRRARSESRTTLRSAWRTEGPQTVLRRHRSLIFRPGLFGGMDDVIGTPAADLQAEPKILADDAKAEAGQRAEKQSRQDDGGVAGHRDIAAPFGHDHQNAGGDGEHQRNGSGPKQQLDREVREVENAVQAIAQLLTDCPCALTFEPPLAFVDNVLAAIAEPEQQGDQVGIDTLKLEQVVAHLAGASENIDAAPW